MLANLQTLNERFEMLAELTRRYRKELTEFQGDLAEATELCSKEEYIQFMNGLSDDVFTGNMTNTLVYGEGFDRIRDVLDDVITIQDYVIAAKEAIWWL